jgi:dihydroxycyclohexadiene carboxylate dehydrogenase
MRIHEGRFDGQTAIVTGAAQGIGRDVAIRLAAEGAQVALIDRSPIVAEVAAGIGAAAIAVEADLETWEGAQQAISAAESAFGRIDVLINNVGGTIWMRPYAEYAPDRIEAEIRRSLFPTLWCCRAVLPSMLKAGGGVIVNVSSVATRGINRVPYAAAKGGVNAMTACLAMEYAAHNIRVCATAPGGTEAPPRRVPRNAEPMTAEEDAWMRAVVEQTKASSLMHRYGSTAEQAAAILFLASREASYITGSVLPVAGGDPG